jgi:predicted nuclease of restriction endonuclease-like RecB superfamily
MAFKVDDFKKTTRGSGGERLLYPYQIRDDRYIASIGYAIAYYDRMVGRRRGEFEAETLLEFFGDARLARGLVACLARTYAWREQTFAEALGEPAADTLWRAGVRTPAALRARLYGLANGRYGGVILPGERAEAIEFLCQRLSEDSSPDEGRGTKDQGLDMPPSSSVLRLTPAQIERALTLDSEDQHVLVKLGPTPEPQAIVALYNYHSLETALCHAELLRLELRGPIWNIIRSAHSLARRYRLRYEISGAPRTLFDERMELTLHGGRDALGSWTRAGRRVVRALLRLLAAHPDSLSGGQAIVQLRGQRMSCKLDARALGILGVAARQQIDQSEPWDEDAADAFQKAWGRALVRGGTGGWRLRRDPEPLIGHGAVVVPDFALQRGRDRLALCLATSATTAAALMRDLSKLGGRPAAIAITPAHVAEGLRTCPAPLATYDQQPAEAVAALAAHLERKHPRRPPEQALTPWQQLERRVADEGFVEEREVAQLMGCAPEEAARLVQRWGGPALHVLPGLGVCAPDSLDEIRALIEQGELAQRAA